MRSLLVLGALLATPFVLGTAVGPSDPRGDEVLRFADPAIVESSGLVIDAGRYVTTNDSGDSGRIFTVDASGRTVGVTRWSEDPDDVEALAPADPGNVWVGDIGDNAGSRSSVSVTRVPVGTGERTATAPAYRLVYPDGARDAEALLTDPTTGRLYVASKVVFGGQLFEAPAELDPGGDNRLVPLGSVTGLVTDGAFFPDGRHLVLRTYTRAVVYTFPGLELVGELDLPPQQQGEGLAVVGNDTLVLSSEGLRAPVVSVSVPPEVIDAMAPPTASPTDSRTATSSASPSTLPGATDAATAGAGRSPWPWLAGFAVMIALVITLLRALRPH
ncbi:MAG: hypothetical protein ACR2JD_05045 [Nocardioides sp.]